MAKPYFKISNKKFTLSKFGLFWHTIPNFQLFWIYFKWPNHIKSRCCRMVFLCLFMWVNRIWRKKKIVSSFQKWSFFGSRNSNLHLFWLYCKWQTILKSLIWNVALWLFVLFYVYKQNLKENWKKCFTFFKNCHFCPGTQIFICFGYIVINQTFL